MSFYFLVLPLNMAMNFYRKKKTIFTVSTFKIWQSLQKNNKNKTEVVLVVILVTSGR